jgi:hypothetical protein
LMRRIRNNKHIQTSDHAQHKQRGNDSVNEHD